MKYFQQNPTDVEGVDLAIVCFQFLEVVPIGLKVIHCIRDLSRSKSLLGRLAHLVVIFHKRFRQ